MHSMGWMGGMWGVGMMFMMFLFWFLVIAGLILAIRWFQNDRKGTARPGLGLADFSQLCAR
jgi:uncharacterized membrane protein